MTDEELSRAAQEAAALLSDSLPAESLCLLPDSPRFRRKMCRLLRQQRGINRFARVAALLFLVITVCFGSILALDADALHFIFGWSASDYFDSIWYHFDGEAEVSTGIEYYPSYIPDGYVFDKIVELSNGKNFLYINEDGWYARFGYYYGQDDSEVGFVVGGFEEREVIIDHISGTLYLALDAEKESNGIIWMDEENGILLDVSAHTNTDELIKMAEGFIKK